MPTFGAFTLFASAMVVIFSHSVKKERGCSIRALKRINARLYSALGIKDDADANARVRAVGIYRDGRVDVR